MMLEVQDMSVFFHDRSKSEEAVSNFHLSMEPGEIVGVVGESGSGKTTAALAVMGLLKRHASVESGSVIFDGRNLLSCTRSELRKVQGCDMAMIFQEPLSALDPVMRAGRQVEESLRLHTELDDGAVRSRAFEALKDAGLDPEEVYTRYPHELSGGQRQRVMIASAVITHPRLLIADEPTTALDSGTQQQVLKLLRELAKKYGMGILFISHDLKAVRGFCERVLVMQKGRIVEEGPAERILTCPKQEYTKTLLNAYPDHTPCSSRAETPVLTVHDLKAWYGKKQVLDGVSLTVYNKEILGLVGESGCGKSTLARCILGFVRKTEGEIHHYTMLPQMVFQDPYSSLNPARKIGWILEEPLRIRGGYSRTERKDRVRSALARVSLDSSFAERYPSQLSGGQRQRVSIALALMLGSKFIVIDEGLSALDITIQGQIMKLLDTLHQEEGLSYLFISHDPDAVSHMCDRVLRMQDGRVEEITGGF